MSISKICKTEATYSLLYAVHSFKHSDVSAHHRETRRVWSRGSQPAGHDPFDGCISDIPLVRYYITIQRVEMWQLGSSNQNVTTM